MRLRSATVAAPPPGRGWHLVANAAADLPRSARLVGDYLLAEGAFLARFA
jgi:hypothetical protein